jgi:hypothetical protein
MSKQFDMATQFHNKLHKLLANKTRHNCMSPDCTEPAIHAHAISKEHALRVVAENGLFINAHPIRADRELYKEIKFEEVGIEKATTFKGFCKKHDLEFSALDKSGINTFGDVFLQLYRSFASFVFEDAAYTISARHAGDKENFNEPFELSKPISAARALALSYDLKDGYDNANEKLPPDDRIKLTPYSTVAGMNAHVIVRRINFSCPVALQKKFVLHEDGVFFDTFVFVIPSKNSSTMIIVCDPRYTARLFGKVDTDIDTLNFIEYCMVCDSHWWLAPSIVQKWSKEKLELIESDYWNFHELKFLDSYDVSLFDETRIKLCETLPSAERDKEISKIENLPVRQPPELRKLAFSMKVERDKTRVREKFPEGIIIDEDL